MVRLFSKNSKFPTYVITIHQRHRQTDDMRSQYRSLQCTKVHRAVKIEICLFGRYFRIRMNRLLTPFMTFQKIMSRDFICKQRNCRSWSK